jgi:hypothetical protein
MQEDIMGTLSKRRLEDFGIDAKKRIESFRQHVGSRIEHMTDDVDVSSSELLHKIEKVPSGTWLGLAGGALAVSLALKLMKRSHASIFVGMLAPTLVTLGLYRRV